MNLNEAYSRIEMENFFTYEVLFTDIANATDSSTVELNIGDKDFLCTVPIVSALDNNGINFPEAMNDAAGATIDEFTLNIESSDGNKFSSDPINAFTINKLVGNQMFKGLVFKNRTKYNFTIAGSDNLGAGSYPIRFRLELHGYKLKNI